MRREYVVVRVGVGGICFCAFVLEGTLRPSWDNVLWKRVVTMVHCHNATGGWFPKMFQKGRGEGSLEVVVGIKVVKTANCTNNRLMEVLVKRGSTRVI